MAKALYGHLAADPALLAEVRHLRARVRELEDDLTRLHAENDALALVLTDDEIIALAPHVSHGAPVLT